MTKKIPRPDLLEMAKDVVASFDEAKGIHTGRFFNKTIVPIPAKPKEVKLTRKTLGATQQVFAGILGVSIQTVKAWEGGSRIPEATATKLIRLIKKHPDLADKVSLI